MTSLFDEICTFKKPTRQTRRRAIELIYNYLLSKGTNKSLDSPAVDTEEFKSSIISAHAAAALDSIAEEESGSPMNELVHIWMHKLAFLMSQNQSGVKINVHVESDMIRSTDLLLPLSGVHGLGSAKEIIREMIVWPRLYAQVITTY